MKDATAGITDGEGAKKGRGDRERSCRATKCYLACCRYDKIQVRIRQLSLPSEAKGRRRVPAQPRELSPAPRKLKPAAHTGGNSQSPLQAAVRRDKGGAIISHSGHTPTVCRDHRGRSLDGWSSQVKQSSRPTRPRGDHPGPQLFLPAA